MDEFWTEIANRIDDLGLQERRIVAPIEFSDALNVWAGYGNLEGVSVEDIDVLVLHKGRFRDIPKPFLLETLSIFCPIFANNVFVLLARGSDNVAFDQAHLIPLGQIALWAGGGGEASPAEPIKSSRMAATYAGAGRVLLETMFNDLMLVSGADTSITPHLIRDGYFDYGMTQFLRRSIRPGTVFVDVGANVGTYSLIVARASGSKGKIIAIEANARIAGLLRDNVAMNGYDDFVTVERVAVGASASVQTMFSFGSRQGGNTLMRDVAEMAKSDYHEQVTEETVECQTLDDILRPHRLEKIDFLKIDVEGYEAEVLRGAELTIGSKRPTIIVEWHPAFMQASAARTLYDMITDHFGYALTKIEPDGTQSPVGWGEMSSGRHMDVVGTLP